MIGINIILAKKNYKNVLIYILFKKDTEIALRVSTVLIHEKIQSNEQ